MLEKQSKQRGISVSDFVFTPKFHTRECLVRAFHGFGQNCTCNPGLENSQHIKPECVIKLPIPQMQDYETGAAYLAARDMRNSCKAAIVAAGHKCES